MKVMKQTKPTKRLSQRTEVYQTLYGGKLNPLVTAAQEGIVDRKQRMKIRRRIIRQELEKESAEVLAEIDAELESQKKKKEETEKALKGLSAEKEGGAPRTSLEYQTYVVFTVCLRDHV